MGWEGIVEMWASKRREQPFQEKKPPGPKRFEKLATCKMGSDHLKSHQALKVLKSWQVVKWEVTTSHLACHHGEEDSAKKSWKEKSFIFGSRPIWRPIEHPNKPHLDVDNGENTNRTNTKSTFSTQKKNFKKILQQAGNPHAPPLMSLLSAWMEDHLHNPPKTWSRLDARRIFRQKLLAIIWFTSLLATLENPLETLD